MADDELQSTMTEGYKVTEKKSLAEYNKLDADDEALNRWKASLGLAQGTPIGDPNDPRTVIIEELALVVEGREDIAVNLKNPGALEALKDKPLVIKEGAEYRVRVKIRVNHEVITGLKYIQVVKRKGIKVDKMEEMLGSYSPNTESTPIYTKILPLEEAPSGMLGRGKYDVASKFTDDDQKNHLAFDWSIKIEKDW